MKFLGTYQKGSLKLTSGWLSLGQQRWEVMYHRSLIAYSEELYESDTNIAN